MAIKAHLIGGDVGAVNLDFPLSIKEYGPPSYRAVFDSIALGDGKYMAVLFSTSTAYHVDVHRVTVIHNNLTAATGVASEIQLLRISAFTTGTAVTPVALDPGGLALPSGISADHNSSSVSDVAGSSLGSYLITGEEGVVASTDTLIASGLNGKILYASGGGIQPIRLRGATAAHRGIAAKNIIATTAGNVSLLVDFCVVPVAP